MNKIFSSVLCMLVGVLLTLVWVRFNPKPQLPVLLQPTVILEVVPAATPHGSMRVQTCSVELHRYVPQTD